MPIKHKLDAVRAQIRARMQAGEHLDWRAVWATPGAGKRVWAWDTLDKWHKAGLIHVVKYTRAKSGRAVPTFAWGPGKDAIRPKRLSDAEKCFAWRERNPEKVILYTAARNFKRRKSPLLDPIAAAMLGYVRCGTGWKKRERNHAA